MRRSLRITVILALANFAAFSVVAVAIGGDALSGKVEAGHVFVANHGRFIEVSQDMFTYSLRHARRQFVTHPPGALAWLLDPLRGGNRRSVF